MVKKLSPHDKDYFYAKNNLNYDDEDAYNYAESRENMRRMNKKGKRSEFGGVF